MPVIRLSTTIHAPIERCFNLSRSIELHISSTSQTNEKAIAGVTSGLIGLNETVTWRAKHFGIYQTLTTKITAYHFPFSFTDEMTKGAFKSMTHQHLFGHNNGVTIMKDVFEFEAPLGWLGKLVSRFILLPYLRRLLDKRNEEIRRAAEAHADVYL